MQTFLPYPDFNKSAQCLDVKRLGKQRLEARQIIEAIEEGGRNHPAVDMWVGYVECLKHYFNVISDEWERRGYKHTMGYYVVSNPELPAWWGGRLHLTHQRNLYHKDQQHYAQFKGPWIPYDWGIR